MVVDGVAGFLCSDNLDMYREEKKEMEKGKSKADGKRGGKKATAATRVSWRYKTLDTGPLLLLLLLLLNGQKCACLNPPAWWFGADAHEEKVKKERIRSLSENPMPGNFSILLILSSPRVHLVDHQKEGTDATA